MVKFKNMPQPKGNDLASSVQYMKELHAWSGDFLKKYEGLSEFLDIEVDTPFVSTDKKSTIINNTVISNIRPFVPPVYSHDLKWLLKAWFIIHSLGGNATAEELTDEAIKLEPDQEERKLRAAMANQLSIMKNNGWVEARTTPNGTYRYFVT